MPPKPINMFTTTISATVTMPLVEIDNLRGKLEASNTKVKELESTQMKVMDEVQKVFREEEEQKVAAKTLSMENTIKDLKDQYQKDNKKYQEDKEISAKALKEVNKEMIGYKVQLMANTNNFNELLVYKKLYKEAFERIIIYENQGLFGRIFSRDGKGRK